MMCSLAVIIVPQFTNKHFSFPCCGAQWRFSCLNVWVMKKPITSSGQDTVSWCSDWTQTSCLLCTQRAVRAESDGHFSNLRHGQKQKVVWPRTLWPKVSGTDWLSWQAHKYRNVGHDVQAASKSAATEFPVAVFLFEPCWSSGECRCDLYDKSNKG